MAYETFWEVNGIKWVFSDDLTNDDLLKCNEELYGDSRFLEIQYQICDFTAVESFPVESSVVRKVARTDVEQAKRNPNVKVAIISNDSVMLGLTRMYELAGENPSWETRFFDSEQDARAWIGV